MDEQSPRVNRLNAADHASDSHGEGLSQAVGRRGIKDASSGMNDPA